MNLYTRKDTVVAGKEILRDIVGLKTITVTLDYTAFTPGIIPAGTSLIFDATTKKTRPFDKTKDAESTEQVSLLFRDIRIDTNDVQAVGLVGGYVKESKCPAITAEFKAKAKMLDIR
ncbi:Uncharacterised protein [Streptococcus pneumoniae]|uniref:hypothetical protein n=1 Tax=Bacillus cereus group TaxID=86661 RepID=UPI0005E4FB79|nr:MULTISPECIES: hypothetical protein [Bacillus cereus group]COF29235.1 Uncharacterised protein [Streptococcus pneumoniae]MDA1989389.1 hypothetical protein [Bacillus cereus group sp. BcHK104]MDF9489787.1 hypothetical protein [Bacillus cereus]COG12650.1 Uncharacterised protein [Streptococcus pneumoniae]COP99838.1 Uncharacterised protein [Streptococcus pneumoniae]